MNNNISSQPITIALKLLRIEKVDTITNDERDVRYCLHVEDRSGNLCYIVGVPVNNIISVGPHLLGFIKNTKVYLHECFFADVVIHNGAIFWSDLTIIKNIGRKSPEKQQDLLPRPWSPTSKNI